MRHINPLIIALLFLTVSKLHGQETLVFEAQDPKADSLFVSKLDRYYASKTGKPFPLSTEVKTVNGATFDFGHLTRSTVVCFGFFGCHPCMRELPGFVQASKDHPEIDFVYITFDAEKERRREFEEAGLKDFGPTSNYHIIHLDRAEIDRLKLTFGYPTKYVVSKDGIVLKSTGTFRGNSGKTLQEQVEAFIVVH